MSEGEDIIIKVKGWVVPGNHFCDLVSGYESQRSAFNEYIFIVNVRVQSRLNPVKCAEVEICCEWEICAGKREISWDWVLLVNGGISLARVLVTTVCY